MMSALLTLSGCSDEKVLEDIDDEKEAVVIKETVVEISETNYSAEERLYLEEMISIATEDVSSGNLAQFVSRPDAKPIRVGSILELYESLNKTKDSGMFELTNINTKAVVVYGKEFWEILIEDTSGSIIASYNIEERKSESENLLNLCSSDYELSSFCTGKVYVEIDDQGELWFKGITVNLEEAYKASGFVFNKSTANDKSEG